MSDIFISYANADRSRTEPLAKALEAQGWSVWWDRAIPPGKTFDQVIEVGVNAVDIEKGQNCPGNQCYCFRERGKE